MTSRLSSEILRRIAANKNAAVAEAIQSDESHVSRITSGERGLRLDQLEPFFTTLGLKVVPVEAQLIDPEYLGALETLSRLKLEKP